MKEISLSNTLKRAQIDDEDFERVSQFNWCWEKQAIRGKVDGETVSLHYFILTSVPRSLEIDHKDTNILNNQKNNLRICTRSQNNCNRFKCNTIKGVRTYSQYKGVTFDKRKHKWMARVKKDGKVKFLGYFNTEIEAASSYNNHATILHGDFVRLNIIQTPK